tara:strand:+ start:288 stop:1469 length:1182 start_codon:yes stop_codon:yes gene_type:complete
MSLVKGAITIGKLPAQAVSQALKSATNPTAIQSLSTAIAKGSLNSIEDERITILNDVQIDIDYNEDRLLATGGIATAISLGTVVWIGSKLNVQLRYAKLLPLLTELKNAMILGDDKLVKTLSQETKLLSNPLINPDTLQTYATQEVDEISNLYPVLFGKEATEGAMFNGLTALVDKVDDATKTGARIAASIAAKEVDEAIEAVIKKSKGIAGTAAGRLVGAVFFVDTIYWLATSALDIGLNFLGVEEEKQRIPFLADIPFIGGLFDLSDSFGASAVDLVLAPILDATFSFIFGEENVEALIDVLWGIIISAAANPTLLPFIIAILDFYVDNIDINSTVAISFDLLDIASDKAIDVWRLIKIQPLDILIIWFYAITGKIIYKYWLLPILNTLRQ